jgi:hypothetical protein
MHPVAVKAGSDVYRNVSTVQDNREAVSVALSQLGDKKGVGSAAIAPQLESICRHKKFKQLVSYSVDCITKIIDPIYGNWVSFTLKTTNEPNRRANCDRCGMCWNALKDDLEM